MVGTLVAASIIERAGRKQLMVSSFIGQAAFMALMALGFSTPQLQPYAGPIAVRGGGGVCLMLSLVVVVGGVGWGRVDWLVCWLFGVCVLWRSYSPTWDTIVVKLGYGGVWVGWSALLG